MTKEPMTPEGVEDKLAEVYGLSTINRMAEADAIESDFKAWVGDNFYLESAQENFLSGLNAVAAANFGRNCALCFRHMLEIALIYPTPPTSPPTKWLKLTNDLLIAGNGSGGYEVTGSLTFEVEWRS